MQGTGWRERGVTSVEYALMVSIIALLLVVGVVALHNALQDRFDRDTDCAEQSYNTVGC
jgi:Flp pilus assembly pilin Flp